jgi:hypothetical protein
MPQASRGSCDEAAVAHGRPEGSVHSHPHSYATAPLPPHRTQPTCALLRSERALRAAPCVPRAAAQPPSGRTATQLHAVSLQQRVQGPGPAPVLACRDTWYSPGHGAGGKAAQCASADRVAPYCRALALGQVQEAQVAPQWDVPWGGSTAAAAGCAAPPFTEGG